MMLTLPHYLQQGVGSLAATASGKLHVVHDSVTDSTTSTVHLYVQKPRGCNDRATEHNMFVLA